jgi:hypothetical protein
MRHLIAPSSMLVVTPTSIRHRHRRGCVLIIQA